jgi:hypothetical protein
VIMNTLPAQVDATLARSERSLRPRANNANYDSKYHPHVSEHFSFADVSDSNTDLIRLIRSADRIVEPRSGILLTFCLMFKMTVVDLTSSLDFRNLLPSQHVFCLLQLA